MSIRARTSRQVSAAEPSRASAGEPGPRVLMLGMGWFPSTLGGLDRYYRSLFEALPEAAGVVVGPAADAPPAITAVLRQDSPLPARLVAYWRAARRAAGQAQVLDAHFALYAAAPLLLGSGRGRAVVFHFHGPWAQESAAAGDSSRLRGRLRTALEGRVLRSADAHVVLSGAFRRVLVQRYRVAPWAVNVWSPGVERERFNPGDRARARAQLGLPEQAFAVVCVRRLVARMGLDVLLDAWGELAPALPAGSQLLLVGEGPLREQLQARAGEPGLAGRVRLLGRVDDAQLAQAYRAADVAVVPSLSFEGFGLVVLEAAACGTPSIVTGVGGLPEVTRPLDPSLVVPAGDAGALAQRLRAAAAGQLPSRTAVQAYAGRFSWPALAERHRALYRQLAAGERDGRPRVVYLDHVARLSGGEIALLRLLPHLRGVNAHVILGEDGPLAQRLSEAGISVELLPVDPSTRDLRRGSASLGGASPRALLGTLGHIARLARRLRQLQPDLVHTNSLKAGVYGSIAARLARVPVVWHVRDRIAGDYLPAGAVRLVRRLVRRLAGAVVANSRSTLQTLAAAPADRPYRVIPDSVEPPAEPRAGENPQLTFGMLGRIAPWKGQDLFLRAFADAFAGGGQRAALVGTPLFGEEDYEQRLRELAAELGVAERVEFRGFREDIWHELASFDVLVHASVIPEPFGQVVIEGMAAGLPVIAPDEGGPADVIADGDTGLLFASRDAASLAAAMRSLAGDPAARHGLGVRAREAIARFHPSVVAAQLEEVYEQLLRVRR